MYIEFVSGADSFSGSGRSVQFATVVYNPETGRFENPRGDDGKGMKSSSPVVRNVKVHQGVPAYLNSRGPCPMWYFFRAEARVGSLWLIHYRSKDPTGNAFAFTNEYVLFRLDDTAPLWRIDLRLPYDSHANIQKVELSMNGHRVRSRDGVSGDEWVAYNRFIGASERDSIEQTQTPHCQPSFTFREAESALKKSAVSVVKSGKVLGTDRVKPLRLRVRPKGVKQ